MRNDCIRLLLLVSYPFEKLGAEASRRREVRWREKVFLVGTLKREHDVFCSKRAAIQSLNILTWNIQSSGMKKRHLAAQLRQVRVDANLTQAQVAEKIGQTQSYVSKYESGEQRLDLVELEAVCNAVGIDLVDFVRRYLEA